MPSTGPSGRPPMRQAGGGGPTEPATTRLAMRGAGDWAWGRVWVMVAGCGLFGLAALLVALTFSGSPSSMPLMVNSPSSVVPARPPGPVGPDPAVLEHSDPPAPLSNSVPRSPGPGKAMPPAEDAAAESVRRPETRSERSDKPEKARQPDSSEGSRGADKQRSPVPGDSSRGGSARGNSAPDDSAPGDSARRDSAPGDAARGDSARGDAAPTKPAPDNPSGDDNAQRRGNPTYGWNQPWMYQFRQRSGESGGGGGRDGDGN